MVGNICQALVGGLDSCVYGGECEGDAPLDARGDAAVVAALASPRARAWHLLLPTSSIRILNPRFLELNGIV